MFTLSRFKFSSSLVTSLVALVCLLALVGLQVPQLNQLITKSKTASIEDLKREVAAEKLRLELIQKIPSLGFSNLIADWVMLSFLQYFGDDVARSRTGYELSPEYFEIIVNRDPHFLQSYLFLSNSVSLFGGEPEKSIALMEKGLKLLSSKQPRAYYVWRYKGIDELLFLGDAKRAEKSFTKAAEWAGEHLDAESENIAALSRKTAEFLGNDPDLTSAQEAVWAMVLVNALNSNDDRTRKQVIQKIEAQGGKVIISPEGAVSVKLPKPKST
ncbi:tetratricopeptide repeat protein [Floridanema evergladense]|uniref:Tetratricopeptide repeat protein n=1 Tax=Floridaenema evergladense BLCC-F167 TaxID=3153639 RepID=A0ABV4WRW7_9CYAN